MSGESISEEIQRITERLEELERRRQAGDGGSVETETDLADEEHRLQTRLQELTDKAKEETEGIAEQVVKSKGGNADEVPHLPDEESA